MQFELGPPLVVPLTSSVNSGQHSEIYNELKDLKILNF
jgi:hypothetical protein